MKTRPLPSQEYLRQILDYSPKTGELIWKKRKDRSAQWNGRYGGQTAGSCRSTGYNMIDINGEHWLTHRIIYQLAYGSIPDGMMIDHINGIKTDNRLENLRIATASQNQINREADSGRDLPKGVYRNRHGLYRCEINFKGVRFSSRSLSDLEFVSQLRKSIESALHGEFSRQ